MFSYLWLFSKRIATLIPGLVVAYVSARVVVPYFNHRLPLALAVFVAYVLAAYAIIPFVWRLLRVLVPARHLPLYAVTPDGFASDPLNIGLVGSRKQLIQAMDATGWHIAKRTTPRTIIQTILSILLRRSFNGMPMSNLYLFGRAQDIGFESEELEDGRGHRHHVRFWATTLNDIRDIDQAEGAAFSQREKLIANDLLWAGAASRDIGITFAKGNLQLTHAVATNTNRERALIARRLETNGLAKEIATVKLYKPYRLPNFTWSRYLQTDGKMTILRLRIR